MALVPGTRPDHEILVAEAFVSEYDGERELQGETICTQMVFPYECERGSFYAVAQPGDWFVECGKAGAVYRITPNGRPERIWKSWT